jgi:hypothetical protein
VFHEDSVLVYGAEFVSDTTVPKPPNKLDEESVATAVSDGDEAVMEEFHDPVSDAEDEAVSPDTAVPAEPVPVPTAQVDDSSVQVVEFQLPSVLL